MLCMLACWLVCICYEWNVQQGLDNFEGELPAVQALPKYPDYNKDVSINDVLGPWHNAKPATGQWRHPFHILWVDGQTNKKCPACRYVLGVFVLMCCSSLIRSCVHMFDHAIH
jgi:hypothetical protein